MSLTAPIPLSGLTANFLPHRDMNIIKNGMGTARAVFFMGLGLSFFRFVGYNRARASVPVKPSPVRLCPCITFDALSSQGRKIFHDKENEPYGPIYRYPLPCLRETF